MSGSPPDGVTIRRALPEDVAFIAWVTLASQRGHRPRGWFDIALGLSEADCLSFIRGLIASPVPSLWHLSRFWVAASKGAPAAALCALPVAALRDSTRPAIDGAMKAFGLDAVEQAPSGSVARISVCAGRRATTETGSSNTWPPTRSTADLA